MFRFLSTLVIGAAAATFAPSVPWGKVGEALGTAREVIASNPTAVGGLMGLAMLVGALALFGGVMKTSTTRNESGRINGTLLRAQSVGAIFLTLLGTGFTWNWLNTSTGGQNDEDMPAIFVNDQARELQSLARNVQRLNERESDQRLVMDRIERLEKANNDLRGEVKARFDRQVWIDNQIEKAQSDLDDLKMRKERLELIGDVSTGDGNNGAPAEGNNGKPIGRSDVNDDSHHSSLVQIN